MMNEFLLELKSHKENLGHQQGDYFSEDWEYQHKRIGLFKQFDHRIISDLVSKLQQ